MTGKIAGRESDAGINDRRLSILHVDTERGWRGGERQALWLAESLAKRGHECVVAARPGHPLAIRAAAAGLDVQACSPRFELDPLAAVRLRGLIRRRGIRIVHAHTGHAVGLAALATIATGAKIVITRRVDFRLRANAGSRWKYRRGDAVIAISEAVARALVASGIERDRIALIPSGVDLTRSFARASPQVLAELGVTPGKPLVVQVSQLVDHKDPVTFVRAMAAVRDHVHEVQALLVGEGSLREVVESEIVRLGLTDVVHLAGYRTDADSLLAAADVVTLSSKEEGLGTVLLDALSMGKPIAATSGGGIPEVLVQDVSGLLSETGDHAGLARDVVAILRSQAVRERLARNAPARAAEFSVERTADRTLAVYRQVLQQGAVS